MAAGALVILTDVDAVQDGYGTPHARPIHRATPRSCARPFPAGSTGPKVEAAKQCLTSTNWQGHCVPQQRLERAPITLDDRGMRA